MSYIFCECGQGFTFINFLMKLFFIG